MSAKKFLIISVSCLISMLVSYAWIVDNLIIIERPFPYSYKQFLLQSSAQIKGKVIVESGSNSIYGIDPFILSEYFNAPVLTVANNAGYPLRPKIFNIEKYVQKGDIVLLPLEWNQYAAAKELPDDFVSALADKDLRYEFYFNNLPFWEKIKFIFTEYPFKYAIDGMVKRLKNNKEGALAGQERLLAFKTLLNSNTSSSFGNSDENVSGTPVDNSQYVNCDTYLFYKDYIISDEFKSNLVLLKNLVRKGVSVYFLWPSVVDIQGNECYQDKRIIRYADEIKSLVEREGLQFIGKYQDSRSPYNCFLNTYYHITHDCAKIRTKALIKSFQSLQIGEIGTTNGQNSSNAISNVYLNEAIADLKRQRAYRHSVESIGNINLAEQVSFMKGWHKLEGWGIWSLGKESHLNFKISEQLAEKKLLKLRVRGTYYDGSTYSQTEKTRVVINGKSFGDLILTDRTLSIPAKLILDRQINIQLIYQADTGNKDKKNTQFGLVALDILESTHQES